MPTPFSIFRLLVLLVVSLAVAAPAAATTDGPASVTELAVFRNPAATDVDQVVYIEAGSASWKIRKVAAALDAQVDGLTIVTGVAGSCGRMPTALCVSVVTGGWSDEQQREIAGYDQTWRGLMVYQSADHRTIYLNNDGARARYKKGVAAHELGHAVGLNHDDWGRMADNGNSTEWFTDSELSVLRDWYAVPRYR